MAVTTIKGTVRTGSFQKSSVGTPILGLRASFDPTSVSQVSLGILPKGAIPLQVISLGGATGGTNPTVDVGTAADPDGLANELDADGLDFAGTGALTGVELTENTEIFGNVGASAPTGGLTTVIVQYIMAAEVSLG